MKLASRVDELAIGLQSRPDIWRLIEVSLGIRLTDNSKKSEVSCAKHALKMLEDLWHVNR